MYFLSFLCFSGKKYCYKSQSVTILVTLIQTIFKKNIKNLSSFPKQYFSDSSIDPVSLPCGSYVPTVRRFNAWGLLPVMIQLDESVCRCIAPKLTRPYGSVNFPLIRWTFAR